MDKKLLKQLLNEIKPIKNWFYFALFLAIFISVLVPIKPKLIEILIDKHIVSKNKDAILEYSIFLFIFIMLESLLRYLFVYITSWFSQNIIQNIRQNIFQKIISSPISMFDKTQIGTLTTRTINDVETINEVYSQNFFTIISDSLTIIIVLFVMFYTDWRLTLISLITLPLLFIATYFFKEKIKIINIEIRNKISELNSFVQERIQGIKIIKSFVAEDIQFEKFKNLNQQYTDLNIKTVWHFSWFFPIMEILMAISIGLIVTKISLSGENFKTGLVSSFLLYINSLFRPMRFIADKFNQLQMGFISSKRVFDLIEESKSESYNEGIINDNLKGNIQFQNVNFEYTENIPILKNLSFDIKNGESLAIVGATGSGKTSIINLLNRFYTQKSGNILIDGINIKDLNLTSLRKNIGLVLQDIYLFDGTLIDNIRLDNNDFTLHQAHLLAKELKIEEFFEQLPDKFNTKIIERGNSLSLGQKQILSFFRAIIKNPNILILDEATSSIDSNTEFYIQKLIPKVIQNKTSIIIAHRLSTILSANRIIVLDKGIIVGEGTHKELIQSNKYYKQYFLHLNNENS